MFYPARTNFVHRTPTWYTFGFALAGSKSAPNRPVRNITEAKMGGVLPDQIGTGGVLGSTWVLAIGAPNIDPTRLTELGILVLRICPPPCLASDLAPPVSGIPQQEISA